MEFKQNSLTLDQWRDPKYYLENFCQIKGKEGGLIPFILNEAQKDLFNTIRKHSRIIILKARQMGFCLDKNTRILSDDLRWITIGDIRVGQGIVAMDEFPLKGRGQGRKMRRAVVEAKRIVYEEAFKLKMDNGIELIATAQHRFLSKKWDNCPETKWKRVADMKIGSEIRYITKPWDQGNFEDGWFGGIIDGEGSLRYKNHTGAEIRVCQRLSLLFDQMQDYARRNGYCSRIDSIDNRKNSNGNTNKFGNKPVGMLEFSRMNEVFRLIGQTRPKRFTRLLWWEGKDLPGKCSGIGWSKIISIKSLGKREMVDIQTSEKTFIAEGFVSHNSTGVSGYFYHAAVTNPGTTTALISYNTNQAAELLDKIKTFWRTTPEEIRPPVERKGKYELSFPTLNSNILVLPSERAGMGYTLHFCLGGDNKILINDGKYKLMKDLREGDCVMNGNGGQSKIKKVIKRKCDKKVLKIKSYGHYDDLILTEDHKVLCRQKHSGKPIWKQAKKLQPNKDFIAFPYFQCRKKYTELKIKNYITDGYKSRSNNCPETIKLNYEFGLFVGWYLAEGSIEPVKKCAIKFCVSKNEIEIIEKIIAPFKEYYGFKNIKVKKNSLSSIVSLSGTNFARFMADKFGCGNDKKIPDEVWYWGWDFAKGLIYGLFCGDGYFKDIYRVQLTNTNEALINQVKKLLVSVRIGLALITRNQTARYGKKNKDRFDLILGGKGNYKFRRIYGLPLPEYKSKSAKWRSKNAPWVNQGHGYWRRGKFHYWAKIYKVSEIKEIADVYDISLNKAPYSFTTVNGVAHNCLCTELSSWQDADEKMTTVEAAVPLSGKLVIESVPRGTGNKYHRMWMDQNNGYVKKKYGWWWGYTRSEIELIRKRYDPMYFAQHYGLEFLASGRSAFDQIIISEQRLNILEVGAEVVLPDGNKHIVYENNDNLRIYSPVMSDRTYVCGVDVSEGVAGGDYSVAVIWDRATGEEAAFYRGLIAPDIFGRKLVEWGKTYNNALMVVEMNSHGFTTMNTIKNLGYPSLYFRPTKLETFGTKFSDRLGWKTTKATRFFLIDDFKEALRDKSLTIRSKEIADEMETFVFDNNNDMTAQKGFFDDCIFAGAIGFQGFKMTTKHVDMDQLDYTNYWPRNFSY